MRKISFIILFIFTMVFLGSCEKEKPEEITSKKNIVIGYSQIGAESSWRSCSTKSILSCAKDAKIQVMFDDAEQKQDNQIKAIRSFIAYQVDVIVLSPMTESGWENVLMEAKVANIPVILTDRSIEIDDTDLFACYIGSDFIEEGRVASQFLLNKFAKEKVIKQGAKKDTEDINIVELSGVENSTPAIGRSAGFKEGIKKDSRFKIIHTESGKFIRSRGKEIVKKLLDENLDIDVLFSHNDAMTIGAVEAMEEKGIRPGKDIVIISFDGEQEAIDMLMNKKVNCVVECTPYLGNSVIEAVNKLVLKEEVSKYIYSRERAFNEYDRDLKTIGPRGY